MSEPAEPVVVPPTAADLIRRHFVDPRLLEVVSAAAALHRAWSSKDAPEQQARFDALMALFA